MVNDNYSSAPGIIIVAVLSGGSQRQNHGAMNNAIEGPVSGVSQHNMTKLVDSGHTVNGALAGWKLMHLSGETSPTCVRDPGARRRVIVGVMGET